MLCFLDYLALEDLVVFVESCVVAVFSEHLLVVDLVDLGP